MWHWGWEEELIAIAAEMKKTKNSSRNPKLYQTFFTPQLNDPSSLIVSVLDDVDLSREEDLAAVAEETTGVPSDAASIAATADATVGSAEEDDRVSAWPMLLDVQVCMHYTAAPWVVVTQLTSFN